MAIPPRILVAGSLVMDLICTCSRFPNRGETVLGLDFRTAPGGKGANQAVQAARLGAEVSMSGKVGKDAFGKSLIKSVSESGVDVSGIAISATKSSAVGNIQLEVTETGSANRILVIPGANMDIMPEDILPLTDIITQFDMVILQLEIPMAINELVVKASLGKGVPVMLNPAPSAPLSDRLLRCLNFISPNEHEAADMTGIKVTNETTAYAAVKRLLDKGVENVLITMGNKGAVFGNSDEIFLSPCVDYGRAIDPTAAGDSFVAAFCTAIGLGVNYRKAMIFANHTAGITVSRIGAQPSLPTIHEVLTFMKAQGHSTGEFDVLTRG